uniref:Uncharacterized protein n=2 Tax=Arion vulgaris TaxID=1028688 RepID=A0A0B7BJ58_9EUPU
MIFIYLKHKPNEIKTDQREQRKTVQTETRNTKTIIECVQRITAVQRKYRRFTAVMKYSRVVHKIKDQRTSRNCRE